MCAHESPEFRFAGSRIGAVLAWLGGGEWRELTERHERSSHAIAGVVVLLDAALVWLVAAAALAGSTHWPIAAILAAGLVFGVLVGAVIRAIAGGPTPGRRGVLGRAAVAVAVGVIVGELAALVVLSGTVDRRLDDQAARNADSAPAVVQAAADLNQARGARAALDDRVEQARGHRDDALVVARCEYNPTPACPQTQITGVPGTGPETRTADGLLADAQRELDDALAARDQEAPALDARIGASDQALALARGAAIAQADRGLGARWIALYDRTRADAGVLVLQLVTIALCSLLGLLPLILKLWRGDSTHDLGAAARAERDRAELEADTAIAVKRAEVRAAAETLRAEQQLANVRLAVEAQAEIDRAQYRRQVVEARDEEECSYLPIAAEAETESRTVAELPAGGEAAAPQNLPARAEPPSIPDVAKAAARWMRPLVPSLVARAINTTTQPLRAVRHIFEEVEEITFTLKRTHKVIDHWQESSEQSPQPGIVATETRIDARRVDAAGAPSRVTERDAYPELTAPDPPRELPHGRPGLPPAE